MLSASNVVSHGIITTMLYEVVITIALIIISPGYISNMPSLSQQSKRDLNLSLSDWPQSHCFYPYQYCLLFRSCLFLFFHQNRDLFTASEVLKVPIKSKEAANAKDFNYRPLEKSKWMLCFTLTLCHHKEVQLAEDWLLSLPRVSTTMTLVCVEEALVAMERKGVTPCWMLLSSSWQ